MKTKLFTIAAVCLLTGIVQSEEQSRGELSNTKNASVTLKIITDPKVVVLDDDLANIIDHFSSGRVYGAGNQVLGGSRTVWFRGVEHVETPKEIGGMQVAKIKWQVELSEQDKPAAREVALAMIGGFRDDLKREYEQNRRVYAVKADVYARRVEEAEERLGQLIGEQNSLGEGLMDKNTVRQRLAEQQKARMEVSMQQAIAKKRVEELAKNIDQLRAEAERVKADWSAGMPGMIAGGMPTPPDKEELERLNKGLESMRQAMGDRERQRQLADEIARLGREHRDALMELEELEIRQRVLAGWGPGNLSDSLRYEVLETRIDAAKENLRRALIERDEFATQMALIRPPVVIEEITTIPADNSESPQQQNP